jgi:hypothetical protein
MAYVLLANTAAVARPAPRAKADKQYAHSAAGHSHAAARTAALPEAKAAAPTPATAEAAPASAKTKAEAVKRSPARPGRAQRLNHAATRARLKAVPDREGCSCAAEQPRARLKNAAYRRVARRAFPPPPQTEEGCHEAPNI